MIDDKAQNAIMEAYDRTILNEYKKGPDFKKSYQKLIEGAHDSWNASNTIDVDFDLYSELKKISKAVDMITMKLVKAKVI